MPPDTMHRKEHSLTSGDFCPKYINVKAKLGGHSTKLLISSLKTERL